MLNKVMLIGHLGQNPEIRTTQNGTKVCSLSVATSEYWKDKATGERKERTEWHRLVAYGQGLVTYIEKYIKKGAKVHIEGKLQTRKYTDKEGVERYSTEIIVSNLIMLDKHDKGEAQPEPASQDEAPEGIDDNIAF